MTRTILIRLFIVMALIVHQGCAHTDSILPESVQENMHRIGVVVKEGQEKSLQDSQTGVLSSMGKGAGRGSWLGGAGVLCMWGAIVCIPILAAAGAVGGSVYGLYQASSEVLTTDVEATLGKAITEADLSDLLVTNLVADAQAGGYPMEVGKKAPLETGKTQEGESPALRELFDTLLEIEGPVVNLLPTSFESDPPRRMGLSARLRVIRVADQAVLDDRIVLEELGDVHSMEEWTGHQAQHFREELPLATRRLSEKILIDYFMRYAFEEHTQDFALFGPGHGYGYRLRGLASLPQIQEAASPLPVRVDSLRPTLLWEQFKGHQVTYDLKIWESKESRAEIGKVIYEREGLMENTHTLKTSLKPATKYSWSVRVRFVQDGKLRVSDWTKYKIGFSTMFKIISFGMFALVEASAGEGYWDWGFYQIQTPQWGELSH
jgi:hypothetical protein